MKKISVKSMTTAKKYAQALFDIAKESNTTNSVLEDLDLICETIKKNINLKEFLTNPIIQHEDKKDSIRQIFENKISEKALNLLYILEDNSRYDIILEIGEEFQELVNESNSIISVKATTAVEMKEYLKEQLKQKLENKLSKRVIIEYETNPQIIGGLIIETDGKVIDNSVMTKLNKIKKQLT